ncbi:DUF2637 domain-containing protein [Streptomyces sp. MZ04]|uniref:DUF2637 domain-containing protein n=1 Tax=Streptomyces sp. MZ04 TaxID=2559236 RepID=UPI00107EE7EE|nr:DUF2637 domain-containing protein [Streptomyces sp. MZ04]TGB15520.1 DUF2637 domain-containing protein [Streptomyces sp. MZ04]
MDLSPWALPAGLAVAGIGAAVTVGMLLGHRRRANQQHATAEERAQLALQNRQAWQRRLAVIALAIGCVMMFVLAGIAAWLSFGAQREYAHAHNGGDWDAATGFALLLDAGALSLSLIRFFEALTLRSSGITRILLLGFVSASAAMNLLHAPEAGAGSAFLAVVPPLVYAVLLEMLLYKIEQVIMGRQKRRKAGRERGYSLLLWLPWPIGAPVRMWQAWRKELISTVDNVRVTGSRRPLPAAVEPVPTTPPPAAVVDVPLENTGTVPPSSPAVAAVGKGMTPVVNPLPAAAQPPAEQGVQPSVPAATAAPLPAAAVSEPAAPTEKDGDHGASFAAAVADSGATPEPEPVTEAAQPAPAPEPETEPAAPKAETDPGPGAEEGERFATGSESFAQETEDSAAAHGEAQAGASADEDPEGREPDTQHEHASSGTGDDAVRGQQRIQIDLSTLPKDEGPRQLAERIYVAHHVAGLPLDKGDLARWAGYTNPRSGGNEYRRLVKEYGPILERRGAAYVDLDWSSLDQQSQPAASQTGKAEHLQHVEEGAQAA